MVYLINIYKDITFRFVTTVFFLSLSIIAFQSQICAEVFDEQAEMYRIQGYEKQQVGKLDEALTLYAKSISLGNESPVIFNDIGVTYEQLGLFDKAEESYLKAIQIDANYLPPYTNLAYLYENKGEIAEAIMYLQERYERAPADDPWKEKIYQDLKRLDPNIHETLRQRELERRQAAILRQQKEQLQLDIIRSRRHLENGKTFLAEKQYDQALIEFDRALALTPNNPAILKAKEKVTQEQKLNYLQNLSQEAVHKINKGDFESAKKIYQEILSDLPERSDIKSE